MNYFLEVVKQIYILLKKNGLLYLRRWKSTLLQLLSPILILAVLVILAAISEITFGGKSITYQPVLNIHSPNIDLPSDASTSLRFYNCTSWNGNKCYSLSVTANGVSMGESVLNQLLVQDYGLIQDKDYKNFTTQKQLESFLYENQNSTVIGIAFLPDSPNTVSYTIYYNRTQNDLYSPVLSIQNLIDNTIVYLRMKQLGRLDNLNSENPKQSIQVNYKNFAQPPTRKNGQVIIYNSTGPTFFSIGAMIILIVSLNSLVVEKEARLRFAMIMMGMKDSAYFVSWFITFFLICLVFSLVNVIGGMIFGISIFLKGNFLILLILFFCFSFSLICFAFLLSTFIKESKSALVLGFTVLAISFILNLFVSNGSVVYQLYSPDVTPAFRVILSFYPPFNFAKVFTDIATKTLPVYDEVQRKFVPGPGYTFDDFFNGSNTYDYVPKSYVGILVLICDGLLFLLIYWYCDNVISDANGVRKSPIFFLYPSYWGIDKLVMHLFGKNKDLNIKTNEKQDEEDYQSMETEDVRNEFKRARNVELNAVVRVVSLRQTYAGFLSKLAAKFLPSKLAQSRFFREKKALRGLNLVVEDNQCVCLLGHNGAGKTTTMNILTGLYQQTSGEAYIGGLNVKTSIEKIRKQLGMCPQHDILWDDLTAEEHLELFGDMKGVPRSQRNEEVKSLLESVDLLDVGHHLTKTYSGGMKRRLSICIACIGSPKLILLDEPTTGLDPFSRKKAWNLIHKMKKGRAMILTTHAMDEADYLSDRIAIMAHGQLKCIGDSLSIKAQYGSGYNLLVVSNAGFEKQVLKLVYTYIPAAKIVSQSAGNYIFNVPKEQLTELGVLLEYFEKLMEGNDTHTPPLLKDWGISQTTLEEVYLKVTKKSEFGYKNADMGELSTVGSEANLEQRELLTHHPNSESVLSIPQIQSTSDFEMNTLGGSSTTSGNVLPPTTTSLE
ncbi:hypothetical protein FDP41_002073 [Naegleria fowleri]|uniref:ABC transporter domain-containing protein n=1 Tax=Naegleria fowleri TaxID=5763 RepID=A0A6A5BLV4_NAEFO|nr:uncharacterized protein FDP41_002073 [Naegleria fowleri]KAF0979003.1 hypothetical protein FDP41_002073 [Naegleria fowleri]